MERKKFERILKDNNAVPINEIYLLFNDFELYNLVTGKSLYCKNIEEVYEKKIMNKTIGEIVDKKDDFFFVLNGGRGSVWKGPMGGGFTSARERGRSYSKPRFPSEFNIGGRYQDYNFVLRVFEKRHKDADHEYAISVDNQGFVTKYIEGGKSSVSIGGNDGDIIIHNHPSGSNFSKQDLLSVSSTKERGIVAVGSTHRYTLEKTQNFKPKEFIKAMKKAKWPTKYDYNEGADWWLRKNAKQFGYKYTKKKIA